MKLEANAAFAFLVLAALAGGTATAAEPTDKAAAMEATAAEVRTSNRKRAEEAQAEAAKDAAEAVRSATKLDLDIRLIEPTSVAGEL